MKLQGQLWSSCAVFLSLVSKVNPFSPVVTDTMVKSSRRLSSLSSSSSALHGNATCRFVTNRMCPFAQKAWIVLEAANVPYQMEEVALYGAGGKPNWFLELNPKGQVPVLVVENGDESHDNAMVLADSDLILDKMATVTAETSNSRPSGLLVIPGPYDVASIEKIDAFRSILREFLPVGKDAVLGGDKRKMWAKLQELDALIEGPFVAGESVSVADCAGFPFLWRIEQEYGRSSWKANRCGSNIPQWLNKCSQQDAFSKTIQSSWWWWW